MESNDKLIKALEKLYGWQYGMRNEQDFTHQLFNTFQKANDSELEKIELSFPVELEAYRLWYEAKDPVNFFKSFGLWKTLNEVNTENKTTVEKKSTDWKIRF
jgi:hypothetical protein